MNKEYNVDEFKKYHTHDELFAALMSKDKLAEKQFYHEKIRLLYYLAKKKVADEEDAEFLARLAFSKSLTSGKPFKNLRHITNFMRKAVEYACLDYLKSINAGKRIPVYNVPVELVEEDLANELLSLDDFSEDECLETLYAEIGKLDALDREIMLLTLDGKKTSEIAEVLGRDERYVRDRRRLIPEIIRKKMVKNNLITVLLFLAIHINSSVCISI